MLVVIALKDILFDIIKSNNNLLNFSILKDSLLILAWFSKAWPIVGWLESEASPNN